MFKAIKTKIYQGQQFIKDIKNAPISDQFRGYPKLSDSLCNKCNKCQNICPTGALSLNPLTIDMGKCIFCGDCANVCTNKAIEFSNFYKLASTDRNKLVVSDAISTEEYEKIAIQSKEEITRVFSRSLKLRQVSAGGCNGCEMELNACSNVNFDMGRFGIDFVASPRHADGLVITGPITENMAYALEEAYQATPNPKIVILVGACGISGGIFENSENLNREFLAKHNVDLYIPGCPVHPLTFINGVLNYITKL